MEGLNIEAYDVDSLRKMVRLLEYENKILKDKLKKAGISYEEVNPFEEKIESAEEYDLDQGSRIVNPPYITKKMAIRFFSMFWGREDVYARRGKNGGYFPQCANRWNDRLCPKQRKEKVFCDECENTKWISLDVKKIIAHLLGIKEDGSDVIGVYPLLPNGTCRFIVFDFDNHEKGAEDVYKRQGNASTGIMATRKLTDNRRAWKGTLTEDELGKVIEQNKNAVTQSSEEENAIYGTTLQPIDDIRSFIISVLTPDAEYDESVLNQITEENIQEFYDTYHKNMEKMAEEYGKTSVQQKYLEKKYNEIKLPVEYESYSSWDTMIMYVETYSIILAIIVGFICAGIFADDFQTKADAVFFSTKYGRTKAVKAKILAGIATTVMIYCMGIILLSVICFGIMGTSGMNTLYQMYQAYSIYIMSYGQYYLLTVVCGFIASMLAASVSMLVAAKMHTISVAVCIPFFLYCLLPFIGRALSGYTTLFNLIPTILTNVQALSLIHI